MNTRIHACLDGEISRDDLSPVERAQLAEMESALRPVTERISTLAVPDLTARVMAALPREVPAAAPPAREPLLPWRAALGWLWRPRSFELAFRPAYALAFVLLLGVALPRVELPGGGAPAPNPVAYVQFRLDAPHATQVAIAGSFTGWKPRYDLVETEPGVWTALIPLRPGVHDYSFVVDGEEWVPDPHAPQVADSFGGTNSRISLPPPGSA